MRLSFCNYLLIRKLRIKHITSYCFNEFTLLPHNLIISFSWVFAQEIAAIDAWTYATNHNYSWQDCISDNACLFLIIDWVFIVSIHSIVKIVAITVVICSQVYQWIVSSGKVKTNWEIVYVERGISFSIPKVSIIRRISFLILWWIPTCISRSIIRWSRWWRWSTRSSTPPQKSFLGILTVLLEFILICFCFFTTLYLWIYYKKKDRYLKYRFHIFFLFFSE